MSVFEPLGLLLPFTLKSKILMQEIWRIGIHRDDKLRDEEYRGWSEWIENLNNIKECAISRCCSPLGQNSEKIQIHIFCDARLVTYAATAYLNFSRNDGYAHVSLIMAKSRVAPLKPLSLPRLELLVALLGANLLKYIEDELDFEITQRFLWSDSTTVLRWIKSELQTRHVFLANRLAEIGKLTKSREWRWVPGDQIPADDAFR